MDSMGDLLAERMSLQFELPDGLNVYEAYKKCPDLVIKNIKYSECTMNDRALK